MTVRAWCVVVPREKGESVRRELRDRGFLLKHLKVQLAEGRLCFPTKERVEMGWPTEEREFEEAFAAIRSYKELVRVPESLRAQLPSSFDVIGDVAVLKIPGTLNPYQGEIGRAILAWNPALRVVARDRGVRGEFRLRDLEILAGEDRTTTVHTEFGLQYHTDVARAYFSPRLGTERLRVANQVQPGEAVADPFAGVGPYAILIARRRAPACVLASDANSVAVALLRENVAVNRADRVAVEEGDARPILAQHAPFDRVILDLPHSALSFLPDAVQALSPRAVVHVYSIVNQTDREDRARDIAATVARAGRTVESLAVHTVRAYSPTQAHVAFDVTVGPG